MRNIDSPGVCGLAAEGSPVWRQASFDSGRWRGQAEGASAHLGARRARATTVPWPGSRPSPGLLCPSLSPPPRRPLAPVSTSGSIARIAPCTQHTPHALAQSFRPIILNTLWGLPCLQYARELTHTYGQAKASETDNVGQLVCQQQQQQGTVLKKTSTKLTT